MTSKKTSYLEPQGDINLRWLLMLNIRSECSQDRKLFMQSRSICRYNFEFEIFYCYYHNNKSDYQICRLSRICRYVLCVGIVNILYIKKLNIEITNSIYTLKFNVVIGEIWLHQVVLSLRLCTMRQKSKPSR